MATVDEVHLWMQSMVADCPTFANLSREDVESMCQGPLKGLLQVACRHVRSTERCRKVKDFMNSKAMGNMEKLIEAKTVAKKLEAENAVLYEKCSNLVASGKASCDSSPLLLKTAIVKSNNSLVENLALTVKKLIKVGENIACQVSPAFNDDSNKQVEYKLNVAEGKMETVAKCDARRLLNEIASKGSYENVAKFKSNYSGMEHYSILQEISEEVSCEAQQLVDNVDLERDAKMLSKELNGEENRGTITSSLEKHIAELTLEHAKLVQENIQQGKELVVLEQQLPTVLATAPEAPAWHKACMLQAQAASLCRSLADLNENVQEKSLSSDDTKISYVQNLHNEIERKKHEVMNTLNLMNESRNRTNKFFKDAITRSTETYGEFEGGFKLYNLLNEHYDSINAMPLEKFNQLSQDLVLPDSQEMFVEPVYHCKVDSRIKSHISKSYLSNALKEMFREEEIIEERYKLELEDWKGNSEIVELQRTIQQELVPELYSTDQDLKDIFQKWKMDKNPIIEYVSQDPSTTVDAVSLEKWLEHVECNLVVDQKTC